ncbi:hypothetical protein Tco_0633673 [Tanacetum coccineum]
MDPNSSLERICLGDDVIVISSDKAEGSGDWNSPEYQDTAVRKGKKEACKDDGDDVLGSKHGSQRFNVKKVRSRRPRSSGSGGSIWRIEGTGIGLHTNSKEQGYLIINKTTQGTSEELRDARLGVGTNFYCTYGLETLTIWYEEYDGYRLLDPSASPPLESAQCEAKEMSGTTE